MAANFDLVRETFANQFEADGDGYLYRRNGKGAPIRVSAAEREGFIAAFNHDLRFVIWGMMATMIAMLLLVIMVLPAGEGADMPGLPLYVGIGLIVAVTLTSQGYAFNAPARVLAGRATAGVARTKEEMRGKFLEGISYGNLALGAVAALVMAAARYKPGLPPSSGLNLFILCTVPLILAALAVMAFCKWRFAGPKKAGTGDRPRWQ